MRLRALRHSWWRRAGALVSAGGWRVGALARESAVSALTQRLASLVTVGVVASLCAAVLLTAGRAEGSATAVLSSLDDSGTRSIVVRAEPGAGLDTSVLERLRAVGGIEWIGAFGAAYDVRNALFEDGAPVASRAFYESGDASGARVTRLAAEQLGLSDAVGDVVSPASGEFVEVTGIVDLPPDLRFLEPVVLISTPLRAAPAAAVPGRVTELPGQATEDGAAPDGVAYDRAAQGEAAGAAAQVEAAAPPAQGPGEGGPTAPVPEAEHEHPPLESPIAVLVVRAASPRQVGAVTAAVTSVLGVADPTKVSVQTSEHLAAVRQQVENQLGDFGRTLVLSTFGGSAALVGAILFALVMMRRRDFGRRRALGASRPLIVALLLGQVGLTTSAASVLGAAGALVGLVATRQPLPTPAFTAAVAILAITTSLVAAVLPAVFASLRDPLRELRVP